MVVGVAGGEGEVGGGVTKVDEELTVGEGERRGESAEQFHVLVWLALSWNRVGACAVSTIDRFSSRGEFCHETGKRAENRWRTCGWNKFSRFFL